MALRISGGRQFDPAPGGSYNGGVLAALSLPPILKDFWGGKRGENPLTVVAFQSGQWADEGQREKRCVRFRRTDFANFQGALHTP